MMKGQAAGAGRARNGRASAPSRPAVPVIRMVMYSLFSAPLMTAFQLALKDAENSMMAMTGKGMPHVRRYRCAKRSIPAGSRASPLLSH